MYPTIRFRTRKDGKFIHPKLYCHIRLNGLLATSFSTNIECIYKFDNKKQTFIGSKTEASTLNDQITNVRTEIRKVFNKLESLGEPFTAQMLRDRYLMEKREKTIQIPTILQCFQTYIEHRRVTENLEETTLDKHTYSMNHFESFIKLHYKRKDFELRAVTTTVANNFFNYMQLQKNQKNEPLTYEHCFRTLQHLVKSLDYAVSKKYLISNCLLELDIENQTSQPKIEPLTERDIFKLMSCDGCTLTERKVIDGFLIMCYTGFRHSDYLRFLQDPRAYIFTDDSGFEYIELYSFKNRKDENQESSFVPLHPVVKNILEHYNYNLSTYSDQIINRYMKIIAPRAEVYNNKITTYTARKSCACLYGNMDGIDIKTVAKILGHKRASTTEKYYFRVNKETVKRQYLNAMNK